MTTTTLSLGAALNAGLRRALEHDRKVVIMGEDVGRLGGVFRVTDTLQKDFGDDRVIDTPLAESGIIGAAFGWPCAATGPSARSSSTASSTPRSTRSCPQVAKIHYRTPGRVTAPLTIRIPYGGGIGAVEHHSESPEAYFAHTAGLRVVTPSNPADAFHMIQQSVAADDPVVFFEPKRRYWDKAELDVDAEPDCHCTGPGCAQGGHGRHRRRVRFHGADGPVGRAIAADEGHSLEVIDLRSSRADRLRHHRGVGAQDRKTRRRARGVDVPRPGRGDRRPHFRAVLLPAGRAGPEGRRIRRSVSPGETGMHHLPDADRLLDAVERSSLIAPSEEGAVLGAGIPPTRSR